MSEKLEIDSTKKKNPKDINTTVKLVIKSGPDGGELIGDINRSSENGQINFTGIQFSEPGSYEIEAVPTSPDLNSKVFKIEILPEDDIIEQEEVEKTEDKKLDGNRPIIAQIDQPTIKLPPIKFDATNNETDDKEVGFGLGFTPFFWYNGVSIPERDISSLEIYYEDFLPKAQITMSDTTGLFDANETMPTNDTKFEIFINSGSDILKSIHMRFKLEINQKNKSGTHTITGTLDIPDFYKVGYKSYPDTTFSVIRKICTETGLGYNSNIKNTNDNMKWRRNGILLKDFIKDIIKHSYISDDSFMIGYIDYYYCFNYVDVEKEWNRDISGDLGISSQGVTQLNKESTESDKIEKLILTNDKALNATCFYFEDSKLKNNSTYQSTKKGTFTVSKVYDRVKKQFLVFNVDSKNEGDDKVILKGAKMDKEESETNFRNNYSGKIDTDNVHSDYLYAVDQNRRNLENLVNIQVDISLPQPNFNLYKFQKVQLDFINPKPTVTNDKVKDERLSGGWIIIDIRYVWKRGQLKQKLTLVRKDLGKTTEEKKNEVTASDETQNNEINENEEVINESVTKLEEGDVYLMEDDNGKRFEVTVKTNLQNDGDFIVDIKEL